MEKGVDELEREDDIAKSATEAVAFIKSPEGQKALKDAIDQAVEAAEKFDKATEISIENLFRPMDI